jgi:anti-sigma factor RsiW
MKNEHILDILDEKAFADLNAAELRAIESHAAACDSCANAFAAARISSVLLRAEAVEEFAPTPFFQTRVMANLRERQAKMNPFSALAKLWQASAAMVVLMMAVVIGLIALTAFAPSTVSAGASNFDAYSTDMVIMNERVTQREPTNEQIFQMIYGTGEDATKR